MLEYRIYLNRHRDPHPRAVLAAGVLASFVGVCAAGLSMQNNLHANSLNMIQSTQVITKVGCVHPSAQASSIMLCFNTSFVSVTSWGFNNGGLVLSVLGSMLLLPGLKHGLS